MKKEALLLIDIQDVYFTLGPLLLDEPGKAAKKAAELLRHDVSYVYRHHSSGMPELRLQGYRDRGCLHYEGFAVQRKKNSGPNST